MTITLKKPEELTIDCARIEKVELYPLGNGEIAIHYSRGRGAGDSYVAIDYGRLDSPVSALDSEVRESLMAALYPILQAKLDAPAPPVQPKGPQL